MIPASPVWQWLLQLLGVTSAPIEPAPPPPPPAALPAPPAAPAVTPPEVVETLEAVKKLARAQAKLAARLDEVDGSLTTRLDALHAAPAAAPASGPWPGVLDAMDLLAHAIDALDPTRDDGVADGLRGVLSRLDRVLAEGNVTRLAAAGVAVDGKRFKVIGTEPRADLPAGTISRVVRAAALRDGQLIREGEVVTARRIT